MHPRSRDILALLFVSPTAELAYRELERRTGMSVATVGRCVRELRAAGLVKARKAANAILVSASGSEAFLRLKRVANLEAVLGGGLVDALWDALRPDALVLFGSYSRGEDAEGSDLDIAVVHGRKAGIDLSRFEKRLRRRVSLTHVPDARSAPAEFRNTLANGIVLSGYLEVA